jgi:hypothetical protein
VSVDEFDFSNITPDQIIGAKRSLRDRAIAAREEQVTLQQSELERQDVELVDFALTFLQSQLGMSAAEVNDIKFRHEPMGGNKLKRQAVFVIDGIEFRVRYAYGNSEDIVMEASRTPGLMNYTQVTSLEQIGKLIVG